MSLSDIRTIALVVAAIVAVGIFGLEEARYTANLPLAPDRATDQIESWTNHADHRRHYLTPAQHGRMARLTAALLAFWASAMLYSIRQRPLILIAGMAVVGLLIASAFMGQVNPPLP